MKSYLYHVKILSCTLIALTDICSANQSWHDIKNRLEAHPLELFTITIPKSGTHLIEKALRLIRAKQDNIVPPQKPPKSEKKPLLCRPVEAGTLAKKQDIKFKRLFTKQGKRHLSFHVAYTPEREKLITRIAKKTLFLMRDPRDQIISMATWSCEKSKLNTPHFTSMLLNLIDGGKRDPLYCVRMRRPCNELWSFGIAHYYNWYLPWIGAKNVYTVYFENLVGSQGGGSDEAQIKELKGIAQHLGITLSQSKINYITKHLFGGTSTFKKGQIGSWREHFTEEHKQAFKKIAGQLLIDLGYEKDLNW